MTTQRYIEMRIAQCKKAIAETKMSDAVSVFEIFANTMKLKAYEDVLNVLQSNSQTPNP